MIGRRLKDWLRDPAYDLLERSPARYCERIRRRGGQVAVVTPASEIMIEGYQGSANSFARAAFLHANPTVQVASHVHAVAHVERGLDLGVPVMVLLREPESAAVSYVQRFPHVSVPTAITRYTRFHRRLWPLRDRVLLVGFDLVTTDFGRAITALNDRFGTDFAPYVATDRAREEVFDRLDVAAATFTGFDVASARPASARSVDRSALVAQIRGYRGGRALRAATESYERLTVQVPAELRVT
ncbi:MAG TPA: hypothetical protein VFA96_01280 [Nocardioides sp.]|nr:hypothetical protein [Nocardioides sp.]